MFGTGINHEWITIQSDPYGDFDIGNNVVPVAMCSHCGFEVRGFPPPYCPRCNNRVKRKHYDQGRVKRHEV